MNIIRLLKQKSQSDSLNLKFLCLHLDWAENLESLESLKSPSREAQWLNLNDFTKISPLIRWQRCVKGIIISSEMELSAECYSIGESQHTYDLSYLKLNLEKAIRTLNSRVALKTASDIYIVNKLELLITLANIALIEVLPLNGFDTLLWLIAAHSHGYNISKIHYDWIMGYVEDLTMCKFSDVYDLKPVHIDRLKFQRYPLSNSLLFFSNFNSDEAVLKRAFLWFQRYSVKSEFFKLLKRHIKFKDMSEFKVTAECNDDSDIERTGEKINISKEHLHHSKI